MSGGLLVVVVGGSDGFDDHRQQVDVESDRLLSGETGIVPMRVVEGDLIDHYRRERQAIVRPGSDCEHGHLYLSSTYISARNSGDDEMRKTLARMNSRGSVMRTPQGVRRG